MDAGVKGVAQAGEALEVQRADDVASWAAQMVSYRAREPTLVMAQVPLVMPRPSLHTRVSRVAMPALDMACGAGHELALVVGLALAQHGQGHVGQGSQVAGGAQGALLRHPGVDAGVEHLDHHLNQNGAHAGHAAAQGVGPEEQHTAHYLLGVGLAAPVQWLRIRLVDSWLLISSGTATFWKSPKPVVMP